MDSPVRTSPKMLSRLIPTGAVFAEDLRQGIRHWALAAWIVLALLSTVVWLAMPGSESGANLTASQLAQKVFQFHVLFWASFVIALGASAIASEVDIAADAVLCRGVNRWQYFGAKCASRLVLVATAFVLLTAPATALSALQLENDLDWSGVVSSTLTGLVFVGALTIIAVAAGSWFENSLAAVAVAWMALYGVGLTFAILEIPQLSPVAFAESLGPILSGSAATSKLLLLPVALYAALGCFVVSMGRFCIRDV